MNNKIGIMSGRLSQPINQAIQTFPKETWKDEFEKANRIGFEKIEWIFDYQKNPIMEDDGANGWPSTHPTPRRRARDGNTGRLE